MIRSIWAIALVADAGLATSAQADDARFLVDVPATDLIVGLATLSAQTGVSIGTDAGAHGIRNGSVHGRLTVSEALLRMLEPTPFAAVRIGPGVWRLASRPRRRPAPVTPLSTISDIVVTARKHSETLSSTPAAIAVFQAATTGANGRLSGLHDVAGAVEGLSATNLGAGRDRPFIRGVADSPFNGFSQATVSVNVDNARVTYDAPEPGLKLVDIDRVEVLKGPQGPLYGTGALGGVYRIVTNRPVLGSATGAATLALSQLTTGGSGAEASSMLNLPVVADRAALRLVSYAGTQDGWIRSDSGSGRLNRSSFIGGRASVRFLPKPGWTIDMGVARQRVDLADSQYVDRNFDDLTRSVRVPEPSRDVFSLLNATIDGTIGAVRLTAATSQAWQNRDESYDVTPSATALGFPAGRSYLDTRRHRVFDEEVRLASLEGRAFQWTAGASYLSATTYATGTLRDGNGRLLPFAFLFNRAVSEVAAFGDGSLEIVPRVRVDIGARLFRATTDDERSESTNSSAVARTIVGVTPSGSLAYAFATDCSIYLRFGTAFRPGGLDPTNVSTRRYDADEVRSLDVGTRLLLASGRLSLSAAAYRTDWAHVQSDYLLPEGLSGTRTAGDASIAGVEASGEWTRGGWSLRAGAAAQRARLISTVDGTDLPVDPRLPVVPDVVGRVDVTHVFDLFGVSGRINVGGRYTGRSRLSFDQGLDRKTGGYATVHASIAASVKKADISISVENLLDSRQDSFSFGNPFRIRTEHQYTPLAPRTITIVMTSKF